MSVPATCCRRFLMSYALPVPKHCVLLNPNLSSLLTPLGEEELYKFLPPTFSLVSRLYLSIQAYVTEQQKHSPPESSRLSCCIGLVMIRYIIHLEGLLGIVYPNSQRNEDSLRSCTLFIVLIQRNTHGTFLIPHMSQG